MAKDRRAGITARTEDYARWYLEVIQRAELADYAPVKGCMVIRPYGFAIWERIRDALDRMIKETGHQNAYFPLLIPVSFLEREAQHVEGFAMECAVVTHSGLEKSDDGKRLVPKGPLEEPLILRPTSETIIWHTVKDWIQSWRDLPLKLNQWANVVRWEMRPRLFLRTLEFLWQEGHTAHADHDEARRETMQMLEVYRKLLESTFAIHVVAGRKSESEKFPGAVDTFTVEAMMQDGKALQAGTSHDLGQNFSRAFDVTFQDRDGGLKHVWTTSWGVSTRLIGALIMAHSDDKGLVLPPALAPIQCVLVPFMRKAEDEELVRPVLEQLAAELTKAGVRHHVDDRDHLSPGAKFYEWEGKGVPLRVEIGPREVRNDSAVIVERLEGQKSTVALAECAAEVLERLEQTQRALLERHRRFTEHNTHEATDFATLESIIGKRSGWALAPWCGSERCEAEVKERTRATIRCLPLDAAPPSDGERCIVCSGQATNRAIFAKAY